MRNSNNKKVITSLDHFIPIVNMYLYKIGGLRDPVRAVVRNAELLCDAYKQYNERI